MHLSERDLQSETKRLRWALLLLLASAVAGGLVWARATRPENLEVLIWQAIGLATVPGKYVVFSGLHADSPLSPWGLAFLAVLVDTLLALALATSLQPLGRVRRVGPWLRSAHVRARLMLSEYPRLRRMAFGGLVVFVFLPLPGSGAVGGTFAGQLLGLSRSVGILGIVAGTALSVFLFAALAEFLGAEAETMLRNPWVSGLAIAAFLVFVWISYGRVRRSLRQS